MPQPIRNPCSIELVGLDALPDHASKLGQLVAISARLENALCAVLALLSGASAAVAVPMIRALSSADAQKAVIQAAAEAILSGEELAEITEILGEWRVRYSERNKLVHNLWGTSPQHPGKAIWCHSSDVAEVHALTATTTGREAHVRLVQALQALSLKCFTYTPQEIADVSSRLRTYLAKVEGFSAKLILAHPYLGQRSSANAAKDVSIALEKFD